MHKIFFPDRVETFSSEAELARFCSDYRNINAGGGLISNDRGEYLMIFRLGRWDLPKGKQEQGESIEQTALREVQEECGVPAPEIGALRTVTHHYYERDGYRIIKHTYWFNMHLSGEEELVPQREEDITALKWVGPEMLPEVLANTYPSILEVF
ncbi:MAG: NUDIX domain-containing protein [Bacteroidales bacterium]|nr:NUDIX domain-containing protein [Bacteroidales bacterium]